MSDRVYLDGSATTPLRPEAKEAMAAAWDLCGNPSSVHAEGRQARRLVEAARASIAAAVLGGCRGARPGARAGVPTPALRQAGGKARGLGWSLQATPRSLVWGEKRGG